MVRGWSIHERRFPTTLLERSADRDVRLKVKREEAAEASVPS